MRNTWPLIRQIKIIGREATGRPANGWFCDSASVSPIRPADGWFCERLEAELAASCEARTEAVIYVVAV
jgi:hypothetical protein